MIIVGEIANPTKKADILLCSKNIFLLDKPRLLNGETVHAPLARRKKSRREGYESACSGGEDKAVFGVGTSSEMWKVIGGDSLISTY